MNIPDNLKRYICELESAHATLRVALKTDPANSVLCECTNEGCCPRCSARNKILDMTEIEPLKNP